MKLKNLPVAARIRDYKDETVFIIAGHDHPGYNGSVLISDFLVNAGCYDAPEPASQDDEIRQFGNNSYILSNVQQWLNSAGKEWYRPAHPDDTPPSADRIIEPYDNKPGFLTGFSETFKKALLETDVHMTVHGEQLTSLKDISVKTRVFLPSITELGLEETDVNRKRNYVAEGSPLPLFKDFNMLGAAPDPRLMPATGLNKRNFDPNNPYPYWSRSVPLSEFSVVFYAGQFGPPSCAGTVFHASRGSCGIRPLIVMDPETELEKMPDKFGAYVLMKNKEVI